MAKLDDGKAALIAQLDRARGEIAVHNRGAMAHADVGGKLRVGFTRHRGAWLGIASLFGLLMAKLPARTKKVLVGRGRGGQQLASAGKAGIFLGALKLGLDILKPLLIAWATKRMGTIASVAKRTESKVERTEDKIERTEKKVENVDRQV